MCSFVIHSAREGRLDASEIKKNTQAVVVAPSSRARTLDGLRRMEMLWAAHGIQSVMARDSP